MLLEKYMPASAKDFLGNGSALLEIRKWLSIWQRGHALIIHGPSGIGKTLAVKMIAREMGYELLEIGADEERKTSDMKNIITSSMQHSFSCKKKLILIDDMEHMESHKSLTELVEKSLYPVVMIVQNVYERNMTAYRRRFETVKFHKVRYDSISKLLRRVCDCEGKKYDDRSIDQMSKMANGDVRAALLDLEQMDAVGMNDVVHTGYRDDANDMFETVKMVFKSSSLETSFAALEKCDNPDDALAWIEENVSDEYTTKGIAGSMHFLSKADIMNCRIIRRQAWILKKYSYVFSFHGVAVSKETNSTAFIRYRVPRFFPRRNEEALSRFAAAMHMSKRKLDRKFLAEITKSRKVRDELGLLKSDLKGI